MCYVAIQSILSTDNDEGNNLQPKGDSFQQASVVDFGNNEELPSEIIATTKGIHIKFLSTIFSVNKILKKCDNQVFYEACNKLYAYHSHSKVEPLYPSDFYANVDTIEVILKRLSFLLSWHNCSVIRTLLEACNCQDGLTLLDEFESQIDLNQPIELFPIPRLSLMMNPLSSSAFTILSIKSEHEQCEKVPLRYIKELSIIFGQIFGISEHALQLLAVQLNPLMMYWMIPKSIVSLISRELHQHINALKDGHILEITAYPNIMLYPGYDWSFSLLNCSYPQVCMLLYRYAY